MFCLNHTINGSPFFLFLQARGRETKIFFLNVFKTFLAYIYPLTFQRF